ncbi:hypothetical protein [uncultured Alteromonas sp.]|jgi:hypothetical protein|uniref:hypothetical protein n=1 Tax=uncultured Alteromonas sp. TaxID=179113 RepID=UPI0025F0D7D8|nr:hypothetical protein [uncultured Alteromonas sp.]
MRVLRSVMFRFMCLSVFLVLSQSARAYDFGVGDINVPEGFEGPVLKTPSEEFSAIGFTRQHQGDEKSTLLQLTVFTPPNGIPELNEAKQIAFSKQYLMQFLEGVKRRRDNFSTSAIETVSIGGTPAARIRWQGRSTDNNQALYGEMYCLIYQQQLLSFHVQDFTDFDAAGYEAARQAVMAITLK